MEEGAGPGEQGSHGRVLLDDAVGQDRRQKLRGAYLSQSVPSVPKGGLEGMPSQGLGGHDLDPAQDLPFPPPCSERVSWCACEQRQASVSF